MLGHEVLEAKPKNKLSLKMVWKITWLISLRHSEVNLPLITVISHREMGKEWLAGKYLRILCNSRVLISKRPEELFSKYSPLLFCVWCCSQNAFIQSLLFPPHLQFWEHLVQVSLLFLFVPSSFFSLQKRQRLWNVGHSFRGTRPLYPSVAVLWSFLGHFAHSLMIPAFSVIKGKGWR